MAQGFELRDLPDRLLPREPRLGGACAPVPADRIDALHSSGAVLLGRLPDDPQVVAFLASVVSEVRALFGVPDGHALHVVAVRPEHMSRLAGWAETQAGGWSTADLSRSAALLTGPVVQNLDLALVHMDALLGIGSGLSVVIVSPRLAAAVPALVPALAEASASVAVTDWVMLAKGVRRTAETDLARAEEDRAARFGTVAAWARGKAWLRPPASRDAGALTVHLVTTLPPGTVSRIAGFLEASHLAYGLIDPAAPGSFHIGLHPVVPLSDLERLLDLLDLLVTRGAASEDEPQQAPASDALMILKPDILSGPFATCSRPTARDVIRGLIEVYTGRPPSPYETGTSAAAVGWGIRNIARKVAARSWYTKDLRDPEGCLEGLLAHLAGAELAGEGAVATAALVHDVVRVLGFKVMVRSRRPLTYRDFLGLYAHNTHYTRLAGDLRGYLLGREAEITMLEADQELSSLHLFKEILRRVIRYPTTHYDALENLIHISDPGADDWIYFERTLTQEA
ncbi:hypothetical protein Ssi03_13830 [Sphaerisporangium siamense]|uniref:Uncharacterized protein n=1 Tax=Sphaerisporangium siamense TaxID=795645 RepID=A0A7W7GBI1_9ACTN|nr:hypothetical protein [Sphaerisporangium siamense]MBB4702850.1 hypothetical protein [Sphaerisporangium siamense]GII83393.1 hypothetical protein Ssi03_13830 [Sphaerisporangium siamense]